MKSMIPKLLSTETVLDGKFEVEKSVFEKTGRTFERYRLNRVDAACVLLWNIERDEIILTRQFRYPVSAHQKELLLEIVAGKIDEGEDALTAAIRETEEEAGFVVQPEKMTFCTSGYTSPGYTTERFHIYIAEVADSDKMAKGGGLEEEAEEIELICLTMKEFFRMIDANEIGDIKTILAAKYLKEKVGWR